MVVVLLQSLSTCGKAGLESGNKYLPLSSHSLFSVSGKSALEHVELQGITIDLLFLTHFVS